MEAIVFDTHLLHELEAGIHLVLGSLYGISIAVPRELLRSATELVATFCTECVPPSHRELQTVLHLLAHDHLFGIVITECHRVLTFFTFKFNLSYTRKILFCCHNLKCLLGFIMLLIIHQSVTGRSLAGH